MRWNAFSKRSKRPFYTKFAIQILLLYKRVKNVAKGTNLTKKSTHRISFAWILL